MKKIEFQSSLAAEFTSFVTLKQLAGYDYISQAELLTFVDRFLIERGITQNILTEETLQGYLKTILHLTPRGFANHFGVLRLFSIWMHQHNPDSYVLHDIICRNNSHSRPAYIFTHEQIRLFLEKCTYVCSKIERVPDLYQTLFSILYTTGIRINEALSLNCNDFYPEEKLLYIRRGKFKKDRYVILSYSMNERLKEYLKQYCLLVSPGASDPLFIGMRGLRMIYNSVQVRFKQIFKASSTPEVNKFEPRIHDLRHTFAVHRLLKWYDSEKDIYSKLPLLSTYMGHVNITSTQVYLQSTNELLQKGCDRFHHFVFDKEIENKNEEVLS